MKNKGFSLVELIIVMAIMSVLIGILAPTYLRYVERTRRTTDCSNIGAILDACEVLCADPEVDWGAGTTYQITISIDEDGTEYAGSGPVDALEDLASAERFKLEADWGPFEIYAINSANGHVRFEISDEDQIDQLNEYSEALAKRLE